MLINLNSHSVNHRMAFIIILINAEMYIHYSLLRLCQHWYLKNVDDD